MRNFSKETTKVINAFQSGKRLTSSKLRTMGLTNPSATVWHLRHNHGMKIQHDGTAYYVAATSRSAKRS